MLLFREVRHSCQSMHYHRLQSCLSACVTLCGMTSISWVHSRVFPFYCSICTKLKSMISSKVVIWIRRRNLWGWKLPQCFWSSWWSCSFCFQEFMEVTSVTWMSISCPLVSLIVYHSCLWVVCSQPTAGNRRSASRWSPPAARGPRLLCYWCITVNRGAGETEL